MGNEVEELDSVKTAGFEPGVAALRPKWEHAGWQWNNVDIHERNWRMRSCAKARPI